MESEIQLSEPEKRYFAELFIYYDTEKNGKIQNYKASELFNSAHLSSDIIKQVYTYIFIFVYIIVIHINQQAMDMYTNILIYSDILLHYYN